ncbi:GNAT family N-acetyltransferase [Halobiforma nitratireducens]|uniref:N-acetyltransferase GCN5 n=1 Tax=Halobiforma nitratireducens JCM 10879 TaxID=1227454 RepID=M0MHC1_9EURY|nr:GNAT family N-acetyltransferase [Halobiforma nitratireducens]EMA45127.1 N-acetyltransferase GCN5 [Halobiforma nitratireducens JCM 10879]
MEIRHLEERTDVRELIRAHGLAWREAYDGVLAADALESVTVDPTPGEVDQWIEALSAEDASVLVAIEEGAVRGFVDLRWGDAETKAFVGEEAAELKAIYVEPAYWNRGIGTALFEHGLETLPDSIDAVTLEVFAANDDARRFYERRGFERTDDGTVEIGDGTYETAVYTYRR